MEIQKNMFNQDNQNTRLQEHLKPFTTELPQDLLHDLICSLVSVYWSNVELEGQSLPRIISNLTGIAPGAELDTLVARILFTDIKNQCLTHAWRVAGLNSVKSLIRCPDVERFQEIMRCGRPAVFVFNHCGPLYAVGPAFQHIGVPVAIFQGRLRPPLITEEADQFAGQLPGMEYYWINDPSTNRAVLLKRAVERLQRGEFVATAIDAGNGELLTEAEFFGHRVKVARGPAILARLTGAPLIPITMTWGEGWSIDFRIHDPVAKPENLPANSGEFDEALTHNAMRFFDNFIRNAPEQLRLDRLARLITSPKVI